MTFQTLTVFVALILISLMVNIESFAMRQSISPRFSMVRISKKQRTSRLNIKAVAFNMEGWHQTADKDDGINFAHDEITCT